MSNTNNTNTGDDDVADKKPTPPKRRGGGGEHQHQKDDSKEETGRDTPRPYATIVGGEGQDFVATTLSTAAQVNNNGTNDWGFHHPSISFGASSFGRALFACFSLFFLLSLSGEPLTNAFFCLSLSRSRSVWTRIGRSGRAKSAILVRVKERIRMRTIPRFVGSVGDFATAGV